MVNTLNSSETGSHTQTWRTVVYDSVTAISECVSCPLYCELHFSLCLSESVYIQLFLSMSENRILVHPQCMLYTLHGMGNNWALWKVQGQSSQLILSPLAGAAHRSERRRPLISPTSSRCSAREREECKWVHSRKPSPAPSTLKSPLTLPRYPTTTAQISPTPANESESERERDRDGQRVRWKWSRKRRGAKPFNY